MENTGKRAWLNHFSFSWYKEQMEGWTNNSYHLLWFGIGLLLGMTLGNGAGLTPITIATLAAGIIGFTTTVATTNARQVNGILGLVSSVIYIVLAIGAKNYNTFIMQSVYILMLDIPIIFSSSWGGDVSKKVRYLHEKGKGLRNWGLTALFFVVVFAALYYVDTHILISPRPFIDSLSATVGFTGAILTVFKFSESYYMWLLQGIMSVILWGITAAQGDLSWVLFATYLMYLANDAIAFFDKGIAWFHHDTQA